MLVINPATEEVIKEVPEDDALSLAEKYERLRLAQSGWGGVPLRNRIEIVAAFSESLGKNSAKLSSILTSEMGKPLQQSRNEVGGAQTRIAWLVSNAERFLSDEVMTPGREVIAYEPLGVICNISAWNYPFLVGVNVFVPALLAGNSVLYKPSEYTTLTGMALAETWEEAGLPSDLFITAFGASSTGDALLDLPFDGYFFTGSYKTGQHIYGRVAHKMVPCQCELGGKDPVYVCDDIKDIAAVAAATADGAFYNNGQSCCSVERIYVHERVYEQYVDEFVTVVRQWRAGDPKEDNVYFGPLAREAQRHVLELQIRDAKERGAHVLMGGSRIEGKGFYFEPTVLTNVNNGMLAMREESFGPIIGIMKVYDDSEAIRLMNDTEFGLTASVYCADMERAHRILRQVNAGTAYWNCCDRVAAPVPWTGRKHSGIGVTLSHAGLRAFTRTKSYHLNG